MNKAIAVFVDANGETATLEEPGRIIVYQKKQGQWQELRARNFSLEQAKGVRALRAGIAEIVGFMAGCKIFVGRSIIGLPYFELEKAGYSIWEFTGKPKDFLDHVLLKEETATQFSKPESTILPVPEDLGNGQLRMSIKEIQTTDSGITSRQALQPILQLGEFSWLEVLCSHVPPWLEAEIMLGKLECISEQSGPGEMRVIIRKKICRE